MRPEFNQIRIVCNKKEIILNPLEVEGFERLSESVIVFYLKRGNLDWTVAALKKNMDWFAWTSLIRKCQNLWSNF